MTAPNEAAGVRERPIIMTGESVLAILAGTKAQTRRVVLPQPTQERSSTGRMWGHRDLSGYFADHIFAKCFVNLVRCPFGQPGDRLWVRENWAEVAWSVIYGNQSPPRKEIVYRAGPHTFGRDLPHGWSDANRWRPSIHMPRWASRITLEVTGVRIERVQDITESDAKAEGVGTDTSEFAGYTPHKSAFAHLWQQLNGPRGYGWDKNCWVWVIEFRRVTP